MKCPKCKSDIHEMRLEGVDFDFCSGCKGIWFDKDELAFMLELKKDIPDIDSVKNNAKKTDFPCPRCNKPLEELKFDSKSNLLVDRCSGCQGIWLDKAELAHAEDIASRIGDPQSKIFQACKGLKEKGYQVMGVRFQ